LLSHASSGPQQLCPQRLVGAHASAAPSLAAPSPTEPSVTAASIDPIASARASPDDASAIVGGSEQATNHAALINANDRVEQ
jgi:hypothetical protein